MKEMKTAFNTQRLSII